MLDKIWWTKEALTHVFHKSKIPFFFFFWLRCFSVVAKDMWDSREAEYAGQCHFVETTW